MGHLGLAPGQRRQHLRVRLHGGSRSPSAFACLCLPLAPRAPARPTAPKAEPEIFASTAVDRSIALYDLRSNTPLRKLIMQTRCNALAWNPMEVRRPGHGCMVAAWLLLATACTRACGAPLHAHATLRPPPRSSRQTGPMLPFQTPRPQAFNFTVANEDCNLYSYDMRKLTTATCVHKVRAAPAARVQRGPAHLQALPLLGCGKQCPALAISVGAQAVASTLCR